MTLKKLLLGEIVATILVVDLALSISGGETTILRFVPLTLSLGFLIYVAILVFDVYVAKASCKKLRATGTLLGVALLGLHTGGAYVLYQYKAQETEREVKELALQFMGNLGDYDVQYSSPAAKELLATIRPDEDFQLIYSSHPFGRYVFAVPSARDRKLVLQLTRPTQGKPIFQVFLSRDYPSIAVEE